MEGHVLAERIMHDVINGHLDHCGPMIDGDQWGVGFAVRDDNGIHRFGQARGTKIAEFVSLAGIQAVSGQY